MDLITPSTTPDVDDSPYIRFAIDQLTRDEEVRGSRHYARPELGQDSEDDDTVERIVPDEGLGYMARHKEMQAGIPPQHPLQNASPESSSSVIHHDVFVPYNPPANSVQYPQLSFVPGILRPLCLGLYIFLCVLMLAGLIFSAIWSKRKGGLWEYGSFGDNRYFVFEYLPTLLGMILLVWLIQIEVALQRIGPFIAMAANSTVSRSRAALLDLYPSQFLYPKMDYFRAAQPVIGTCFLVFWLILFTIPLLASAFNVRYIGEAGGGSWRWVVVDGVIWTVVGLYALLIVTLVLLAVYLQRVRTGLKWDPRSIADTVALLERANVMADYADSETFTSKREFQQRLWNRTDRLGYWHTSRRPQDIFYGLGEEGAATRRYSLEHGRIREKPASPSASLHSSTSELAPDVEAAEHIGPGESLDVRADLRSVEVRRHYTPWNLTSTALLAFMILAVVLWIAFLVVCFVNKASARGFFPKLPAAANSTGFSAANFLYSFIPALLGLLLFLLWQPLDFTHRRLAPFKALSELDGATAENSLLLDYTASLPFSATISAAANGHYIIMLTSLFAIFHAAIPILAGGIFWAQWYPTAATVRVAADPAGLYALCVFVSLYAVGFIVLFAAGRAVALPHSTTCLAELISWLYQSPLLADRAFARPGSKADLVSRLVSPSMASRRRLGMWNSVTSLGGGRSRTQHEQQHNRMSAVPAAASDESVRQYHGREAVALDGDVRYGFGVYVGRDGREHLGIDKIGRRGREMVVFGNQGMKSWLWK
jgi:hypothetical protein